MIRIQALISMDNKPIKLSIKEILIGNNNTSKNRGSFNELLKYKLWIIIDYNIKNFNFPVLLIY